MSITSTARDCFWRDFAVVEEAKTADAELIELIRILATTSTQVGKLHPKPRISIDGEARKPLNGNLLRPGNVR